MTETGRTEVRIVAGHTRLAIGREIDVGPLEPKGRAAPHAGREQAPEEESEPGLVLDRDTKQGLDLDEGPRLDPLSAAVLASRQNNSVSGSLPPTDDSRL
jgi:hypothetical protein